MKDLTGHNELHVLCADWLDAKKKLKEAQELEKTLKTSLVNHLNKNQVDAIKCGQFEIERTHVKGNEGRVIGFEDVGQVIGKRAGYDKILINEVK